MDKYFKLATNRIRGGSELWTNNSPASIVVANEFFETTENEVINVEAPFSKVSLSITLVDFLPTANATAVFEPVVLSESVKNIIATGTATASFTKNNYQLTANDLEPTANATASFETNTIGVTVKDIFGVGDANAVFGKNTYSLFVNDVIAFGESQQNATADFEKVSYNLVLKPIIAIGDEPTVEGSAVNTTYKSKSYDSIDELQELKIKVQIADSEIIEIVKITLTNFII